MKLPIQAQPIMRSTVVSTFVKNNDGVVASVQTRCQECCQACHHQPNNLHMLACIATCQATSGGLCKC